MPRKGSINIETVAGREVYTLTPVGLVELQNLAEIGMSIAEMARFFAVSDTWLSTQLKSNPAVREAIDLGSSTGEYDLRAKMHEIAKEGDVKMLAFLGERRLKMNKTVEHDHKHTVNVIGTMPQYKLESSEWKDKFAPKGLEPPAPSSESPILEGVYDEIGDENVESGQS